VQALLMSTSSTPLVASATAAAAARTDSSSVTVLAPVMMIDLDFVSPCTILMVRIGKQRVHLAVSVMTCRRRSPYLS